MKLKAVSGIMLALLLIGMLILAFNIQPVKASGTIYIRADGSIEGTTDISTVDNITYTFTNNISDSIVIERDNIVVDGTGCTLQGTGSGTGIYLSNRNNVTVENTNVTGFEYGIRLYHSSKNTISENTLTNNYDSGIWTGYSNGNTIIGNTVTSNAHWGIILAWYSNGNDIIGNTVTSNGWYGIVLFDHSGGNTVTGNTVTNNHDGIISFFESHNNILTGNMVSNNSVFGMFLRMSSGNILRDNNMTGNKHNFCVYSDLNRLSDCIQDIDTSNTVDGKPIYYWVNQHDKGIPADAGFVGAVNCVNITVEDLNLTKNHVGVGFVNTTDSTIRNVTALNNLVGISLFLSSGNTISGSTITSIGWYKIIPDDPFIPTGWKPGYGIVLVKSSNNTIYHNNIIDNDVQANVTAGYANFWDDGYPSGGNYWSDYNGVDVKSGPNQDQPNSDGIGDTPYVIDADNQDCYPLMYPWGSPPPSLYTLTIYSSPAGVTFTVNGVSRTTPWSGTYSEGASVSLVMPESHDGYEWSYWQEDGDPNRTRTVTMDTNITLTGVYVPAPKPVGGKATPINMPMNSPDILPPFIGITTLLAVAVVTVVYVRKRKRDTEINS